MSVSTQGLELQSCVRAWRVAVELLSSMRFAISLLTLICIASVIGTVVKQHEPLPNYVNQFGPFWADVFASASLYNVYSAWWFLTILGFLVVSTSLCVARNTPKILNDLRTYKENIREQGLAAFGHRAHAQLPQAPDQAAQRAGQLLAGAGWKVKLVQRHAPEGAGWMLAAKAGSANKLGYIAAHSAIVLVCLGGLLDGDLLVRAQMWFAGKTVYAGGGMLADVAPQHRLSVRNPTFRGNLMVVEGTQSDTAILSQSDGILLQELPFAVELKKFIVEYYDTGMPKLFASDIVIHDKETGQQTPARVEVNHPVHYKGVEIYQSSFDDGGSSVRLEAIAMHAFAKPFEVQGVIGGTTRMAQLVLADGEPLSVEYTGLRVINVENFANPDSSGADARAVDLRAALTASMGAANKTAHTKELRNVGPSVSYKLRDPSGQAKEFNNYMVAVDMGEGVPVFLWGMRELPSEPFRYLRIPADAQASTADFMRLRYALQDPQMRTMAIKKYASKAVDAKNAVLVAQLEASAARVLELFADAKDARASGLQKISDFIETNVPQAQRNTAGDALVRILNGVLFELFQLAREQAGLPRLPLDERTHAFMTQAVLALSDIGLYPAPVALQLKDFSHVQASVFQVTRAPGKSVVYLGCALLIFGVFAMLYVRERRLWIWFAPSTPSAPSTAATMAMSFNRKTLDGDREFEQLKSRLLDM